LEELGAQLKSNEYYDSVSYIGQSAKSKRDMLWKDINQDHGTGSYPVLKLSEFFVESMDPTFYTHGDALPKQKLGLITSRREKLIHSVAGHALVSLDAVANPFTGIFKGSTQGIIRLSSSA
jgi:hypothetical protein